MAVTITDDSIFRDGERIADYDPEKNVVRSEKRLAPSIMGEIGQALSEKPKYEYGPSEEKPPEEVQADPVRPTLSDHAPSPSIGRIVRFVGNNGHGKEVDRPAIVVAVNDDGTANLQVFMDGNGGHYNDGTLPVVWQRSVSQSDGPETGKFHFPNIAR